jgi:hypothetical protein
MTSILVLNVLRSTSSVHNLPIYTLRIITFIGVFISFLWYIVMRRKMNYTHGAEELLEYNIPDMYREIKKR